MPDNENPVDDFQAEVNIFGDGRWHVKLVGPARKLKSMVTLFNAAKESFGLPKPSGTTPSDNGGEVMPHCQTCGDPMEFKKGKNKDTGKPWAGYFCPRSDVGITGHDPIWKSDWDKAKEKV